MLPKWDNSYSVNNAKIDQEHKKLFELAAEVEKIWDRPVKTGDVKSLLAEFFNYMKEHFHNEEEYMQTIGFPELSDHKKIHKEIIQTMIDLIKGIKTTNDLKEKLYLIVKKWLLEHILYEDMKVAKWRKEALSNDEGSGLEFEEYEEGEENKIYLYICGCEKKVHDVPYGVHKKIQEGAKFRCKSCKQDIKFFKTT